jgi:hypothetical protein
MKTTSDGVLSEGDDKSRQWTLSRASEDVLLSIRHSDQAFSRHAPPLSSADLPMISSRPKRSMYPALSHAVFNAGKVREGLGGHTTTFVDQ